MLLMSDVQPTVLALRRAVYTHYLLTHNARSSSPPIHTRMDSQTMQGPRREWGLTLRSPSSNIRGASAGGEVPDRFISVYFTIQLEIPYQLQIKLDGVGPIDNRPATDKLHHFAKKEEEKK